MNSIIFNRTEEVNEANSECALRHAELAATSLRSVARIRRFIAGFWRFRQVHRWSVASLSSVYRLFITGVSSTHRGFIALMALEANHR
jgi:hypothetical protein